MLPTGADTPPECSTTVKPESTMPSFWSVFLVAAGKSRTLGEATGENPVTSDSPQETPVVSANMLVSFLLDHPIQISSYLITSKHIFILNFTNNFLKFKCKGFIDSSVQLILLYLHLTYVFVEDSQPQSTLETSLL